MYRAIFPLASELRKVVHVWWCHTSAWWAHLPPRNTRSILGFLSIPSGLLLKAYAIVHLGGVAQAASRYNKAMRRKPHLPCTLACKQMHNQKIVSFPMSFVVVFFGVRQTIRKALRVSNFAPSLSHAVYCIPSLECIMLGKALPF